MSWGTWRTEFPTTEVRAADIATVMRIRMWTGVFWAPNTGEVSNMAEQRTNTNRKAKKAASVKLEPPDGRDALEADMGVADKLGEHPAAHEGEHDRDSDQLRHKAEGHLLDLGHGLEDADQQADE